MPQIVYENKAATLSFRYQDVVECLNNQINEKNLEEDSELLRWLQDNSALEEQVIKINEEDDHEGKEFLNRIVWVVKDLLLDKKGNAYCKKCDRNILSSKIKKNQVSPFDVYKGIDKKTLKGLKKELGARGHLRLPGSGGTTFYCDKGHELFGTRDWIT